MMIDLKELAIRESENVEWKTVGDDRDVCSGIARTICAFSNDIANVGGGYVVCGASETKDEYGFSKVVYTGLKAEKLKEIENKVLQHCRDYISPSVAPRVQEIENPLDPATRILVFIVPASRKAHTYRSSESVCYYVRIGRETREARNGILRELLSAKQEIIPFDKKPNSSTTKDDLDLLLFRDSMTSIGYSGDVLENYISSTEQIAEFVPPLLAQEPLSGRSCLRNFALFLFGKKKSITLNFPDCFIVISTYKGDDRGCDRSESMSITGSIIEQSKKALDFLDFQTVLIMDKTSEKPNKNKYPKRALQEAVVNAIVHRDYEMPEPIRITVFLSRIEIYSPGALHWGVDREKFVKGNSGPKWRNQSFAYIFNKMQLAQAEGQGINTIIKTMEAEGCPPPSFEFGKDSVTCILYGNS